MGKQHSKSGVTVFQNNAQHSTHAPQPILYPVATSPSYHHVREPESDNPFTPPPLHPEADIAGVEDNFRDELGALEDAHYFLYIMLESFFYNEEVSQSMDWRLAYAGFLQWKSWLQMRVGRVLQLANQESDHRRKAGADNAKVNNCLQALLKSLPILATDDRNQLLNATADHAGMPRSVLDQFIQEITME